MKPVNEPDALESRNVFQGFLIPRKNLHDTLDVRRKNRLNGHPGNFAEKRHTPVVKPIFPSLPHGVKAIALSFNKPVVQDRASCGNLRSASAASRRSIQTRFGVAFCDWVALGKPAILLLALVRGRIGLRPLRDAHVGNTVPQHIGLQVNDRRPVEGIYAFKKNTAPFDGENLANG